MTSKSSPAKEKATLRAPNWGTAGARGQAPAISSFEGFHLGEGIREALAEIGYAIPTPVQAACIPLVVAGIDLIVQAQTGTGKTAAFAVPSIELLEPGTRQVEVLVLAPTRELAVQVATEFGRLAAHTKIPVTSVYGGTGFQKQLDDLKTAQVVCATPGRLLDLLKRKALTLDNLKLFILDEADEMLNMGFEKEVEAIVERLPEIRQNLLFSATVTEDIKRLAAHILTYPEYVSLSSDQVAAKEVEHIYYSVNGIGRLRDLIKVIEYEAPQSALIFANTKEDTFLVTNFLKKHGIPADVLNGDLPQRDREKALGRLKDGTLNFLVATDVAARGIDVSELSHVINMTLPESPEVYVHRTGRTGRAGKRGVAISLISPREIGIYYLLRRIFKIEFTERVLPTMEEVAAATERRAVGKIVGDLDEHTRLDYGAQLANADRLLESEDARRYVAKLLAFFATADRAAKTPVPAPVAVPPVATTVPVRKAESKSDALPVTETANEDTKKDKDAKKKGKKDKDAKKKDKGTKKKDKKDKDAKKKDKKDKGKKKKDRPVEALETLESAPEVAPPRPRRRRSRVSRSVSPVDLADLHVIDDEASVGEAAADSSDAGHPIVATGAAQSMVKMHVNLGSSKLRDEAGVVNLVCDIAGIEAGDCGEVTLRQRWCYVMVREDMVRDIVDALCGEEYDGISIKAELAIR